MIRVTLPFHLRNLAGVDAEVQVDAQDLTIDGVLNALEMTFPQLKGAIRDHGGGKRRPFVRFFVGQEDWSHRDGDTELPEAVVDGSEPFMIVGAIAGG